MIATEIILSVGSNDYLPMRTQSVYHPVDSVIQGWQVGKTVVTVLDNGCSCDFGFRGNFQHRGHDLVMCLLSVVCSLLDADEWFVCRKRRGGRFWMQHCRRLLLLTLLPNRRQCRMSYSSSRRARTQRGTACHVLTSKIDGLPLHFSQPDQFWAGCNRPEFFTAWTLEAALLGRGCIWQMQNKNPQPRRASSLILCFLFVHLLQTERQRWAKLSCCLACSQRSLPPLRGESLLFPAHSAEGPLFWTTTCFYVT